MDELVVLSRKSWKCWIVFDGWIVVTMAMATVDGWGSSIELNQTIGESHGRFAHLVHRTKGPLLCGHLWLLQCRGI